MVEQEVIVQHHTDTLQPFLTNWKNTKKPPNSLLLLGETGIGKREMAIWLSRWLNCETNVFGETSGSLFGGSDAGGNKTPCEECSSCKKSLSGSWVDFKETGVGEDTLKTDTIRDLVASQGHSSYESAFRIVLIADAARLTTSAANALLKILEEPPQGWIFILTARDSSDLLPTLVSRLFKIRLKPLPESTLEKLLPEKLPPHRKKQVLELAQGSWKRAVTLASAESDEVSLLISQFLQAPEKNFQKIIDTAAASEPSLLLILDQLEWICLERMRDAVKKESGVNLGLWQTRAERLFKARKEMSIPLNQKLWISDLLTPWLQAESRD